MKKTFPIIAAVLLIALIFTLAACGKAKDDMKNDITTLKDDATSMMDDISSALSGIGDEMTAEGNVTDNNSSTGLFEDSSTTEKESSDAANASDTTVG